MRDLGADAAAKVIELRVEKLRRLTDPLLAAEHRRTRVNLVTERHVHPVIVEVGAEAQPWHGRLIHRYDPVGPSETISNRRRVSETRGCQGFQPASNPIEEQGAGCKSLLPVDYFLR